MSETKPAWKPTSGADTFLAQLKMGADMARLDSIAAELVKAFDDKETQIQALRMADEAMDAARTDVLLSGAIDGKNEALRAAQVDKWMRTDEKYVAARQAHDAAAAQIGSLSAKINGLEAQASALKAIIGGKGAILTFLAATSN